MSFTYRQLSFIAGLIICMLMTRVMTSPVVRQKRSDDGGPLEAVVEQLSAQVNHLSAQLNAGLNSVNAEVAMLRNKTATLDKTVAFQAWSDVNPVQAAAHATVILGHVITNVGNGYDGLTGVFTAPVSGVYNFQATVLSNHVGTNQQVGVAIYVANDRVASALSDTHQGTYEQATMNCIIHIPAGQIVYLKNLDNVLKQYHGDPIAPYTTFSGFLVKAD